MPIIINCWEPTIHNKDNIMWGNLGHQNVYIAIRSTVSVKVKVSEVMSSSCNRR